MKHNGVPLGKFEDIGGVACYVVAPESAQTTDGEAVLVLSDIYGGESEDIRVRILLL
jgi:hypothetical protein